MSYEQATQEAAALDTAMASAPRGTRKWFEQMAVYWQGIAAGDYQRARVSFTFQSRQAGPCQRSAAHASRCARRYLMQAQGHSHEYARRMA